MALTSEIVSDLGRTLLESVSLVWMELTMFAIAGIVYVLFTIATPTRQRLGKLLSTSKEESKKLQRRGGSSGNDGFSSSSEAEAESKDSMTQRECVEVLRKWDAAKGAEEVPEIDVACVVDAMRKLRKSTEDILTELRIALASKPALLPCIEGLIATLIRDDNIDLLTACVNILEELGHIPSASVYAGLMNALLRRRDFNGVKAVASKVSSGAMTPKMLAILATSEAQRGCLQEALNQIRQIPTPGDGARCPFTPVSAAQVLALVARTSQVQMKDVTDEFIRLNVRLESRHFEDIINSEREGKRRGAKDAVGSRDLLDAVKTLQVQKGPGMYQLLANVLAQESDGVGLKTLLQELETESTSRPLVNEPLALSLLEACKAIKSGDLACRVLEMHRSASSGSPTAKVCSGVCSVLCASERPAIACDFYEREMLPRSIWPDATLTGSLMRVAAQAGRSGLAKRLSDHASHQSRASGKTGSSDHVYADLQRSATMIKAYARERNLAAAKSEFNKLKASGVQLLPQIYNSLLDAYVHCGDLEGALQLFEEMKEANIVDVVGYNTVLKAHLSRGNSEDARALVEEMTTRGLQASKVTYNELLHSRVMAKDRRGTWELIEEMHAAGVRANSVTCSILLKSLSQQTSGNDVKRIMDLIDEVEEPIDEVLFSSVIEGCIRIKQLDLLSDLMRRYRQKGGFVNLTAPTYGSMIKAYGQAGDVVRVHELWNEMEERGVKPTSITLGCMTEALVTNNQFEEAWQLLHSQLESEERRACINTVIYSTVLKGFATAKQIDRVFTVYNEMRGKDIPCNTITYNTMLDACAKCCAMNRAPALLEDMRQSSVEPDIITYSTIIKGYCVEGDVKRAFEILEDMKKDDKFVPDEIMYNSILDGCAKRHCVEEALKTLDEMKSVGIGPSNYTLSILVKILGHARRLGQAFRMVDELSKENGFRPNVQVYTCLVQACVLNRRLDKAISLHDTMVADSACRVDEKFYAVLIRGCIQMHQPLKAVDVVRAAFHLPGTSLALPTRAGRPVGVEAKALDELAAKLRASGAEEQEALDNLSADLFEHRQVRIGDCNGTSYGCGRQWAGKPRGPRGPANRNTRGSGKSSGQ